MTSRGASIRAIALAAWGLVSLPAAADVTVIVSSEVPVESMSTTQVQNIFLGRSSYFPGQIRAIPVDQAEGSETQEVFYRDIMEQSAAQMKAHWSKILFTGRGRPPRRVANDEEMKQLIAENPGMIGYIGKTNLDSRVKALELTP